MKLSQSGQITVELILLMVVLVSVALFIRKTLFLEGEFLANLVAKPWENVAGMIESGSFKKPAQARIDHPGRKERHLSVKGVEEK